MGRHLYLIFGTALATAVGAHLSAGMLQVIYWIVGLGVLYYFSHWIAVLVLSRKGPQPFAHFLGKGGLATIYNATLTAWLDRFDRWLCPPEMLDATGPYFVQPLRWQRAWNWRAYDRILLLAVAYPIGLPVLIWMLTGTPAMLGNIDLILAPEDWWQIPLAWTAMMLLVLTTEIARRNWHEIFLPMLTARFHSIRSLPKRNEFKILLLRWILASAVTFAATFAIVIAIDVARVGTAAGIAAGALAVAGIIAVAGASAGVGAVTFAFMLGIAIEPVEAGAAAVGVSCVAAFAATTSVTRRLYSNLAYTVLTVTLFTTALLSATWIQPSRIETAGTLLLFLALFPLINAIWDFLSLGLTRWCLRQSAVRLRVLGLPAEFRPLLFNLIDLAGALVSLAGLILSLLFAVSALNALAPEPVLPLTRLMIDLRPGPGGPDMTWAYLMVFSTLLPTAAHLVLFLTSLVMRFPGRRLCRALAALPENADRSAQIDTAASWIAAWVTLPIAAALLVLWYLVPQVGPWHDHALNQIIDAVQWAVSAFGLA